MSCATRAAMRFGSSLEMVYFRSRSPGRWWLVSSRPRSGSEMPFGRRDSKSTSRVTRAIGVGLVAVVLAVACGPAQPAFPGADGATQPSDPSGAGSTKRVNAAIFGEPTSVIARMNTAQVSIPGAGAIEQLANAALSDTDGEGKLRPQLAEAVPTTENGLWQLLPDGRMETTWRIREGAVWHDGTPVTSADLVFATTVDQDADLPILRNIGYQSVESVEAVDQRTVTVRWSRPYIDADSMFAQGSGSTGFGLPLPRHLLEETYASDKANFLALPYWSQEFVGTGAYTVREFVPGSHVLLQANDRYTSGRPKIDEIDVRFILDINVIVTNLLAGSIDMTLGRGFSIENVIQVRNQWPDGITEVNPRSWIVIHPQFMDPTPGVLSDVRFRRALMYATDRQQLVDSLQAGLSSVADAYLAPGEPEYPEVEDAAVRYKYDPRQATQLIEEVGYSKGPDGLYRDAVGQRLSLEMRTYGVRVSDDATVSIADAWTRFGLSTEPLRVSPQRISDREYMATFPTFLMYRQPNTASDLARTRGALAPTPETRFVGSNYARYVNPEYDSLVDRFLTTIPRPERIQVLRQIIRHISENLNLMGLFYDVEIGFLNNRLQNVKARENRLWDIQEWDTR
ncbi:MAG: hypothetical protein GEU73_09490 [Chloroflexi bacterium]|nr:hypothetical protein [Chloroflexota bacterium]